MKKIIFLICISFLLFNCQETTTNTQEIPDKPTTKRNYPPDIQSVMAAHGSVEQWQKMKALTFEIVDSLGNERTQTDLQSRQERIQKPNFDMGYDGNEFWVKADTNYKGNPVFYKNLMFYFYAMPFVLADEGIIYSAGDTLSFEGLDYPSVLISYEDGVGVASKDEYKLYYHPETKEMAWLAYTVTYFSGEKGDRFSFIRYDDWQTINGLKLPKSAAWYRVENGLPVELRKRRTFANVHISETPFDAAIFAKIEGAKVIEE